jgi:signal transduction histidine kinase
MEFTKEIPPLDVNDSHLVGILLAGLPHAVRVYDTEFKCVMANDLGRNAVELRCFGPENGITPTTAEHWEKWPVKRALQSGHPATQEYVVEVSPEQTVFLEVMALPVRGRNGSFGQVIEITRDTTDSKIQTAKMGRLDLLLSEMVDQLSGVVDASDSLSGLPERLDLVPRPETCPNAASCPLCVPGNSAESHEESCSHEICARCQISQLTYPENLSSLTTSLDGLLATLRKKHHQLLESQREVLHAERLAAVGELVAGITHEINNPLGIIIARLDAMEVEAGQNTLTDKERQDFQVIRSNAERIARTVRSLLDFCRKSPGRQTKDFDVQAPLRESLGFMNDILTKRGIQADFQEPEGPLPVRGDPGALQQVFVNLFINAADAMGRDGTLIIRCRRRRSRRMIDVSVSDTGGGISPTVIQRVFDPFFTTKQSRGGTGLGLSVSRRIAREHGGELTVVSAEGVGATFTVSLPVSPEVSA